MDQDVIGPAGLHEARGAIEELAPVLRRAASLDPSTLARIRIRGGRASVMLRLPFGVLVGRTVAAQAPDEPIDVVVRAPELLAWLDGDAPDPPGSRDADWRGGLPPVAGWQRVDTVPDHVIRNLVRSGARTLQQAAERDGMPGAQPRAEVTDALLDSVVLTVRAEGGLQAAITLRMVSALTRMGFLPRGSHAGVDVAGRWLRVAAEYGSVFAERGGLNIL
ncbi:MAG: hypothetical protein QOH14_2189 [Pseudonocardiales bacterium]|nr:hypothetical protein [Pseudonocardiales bacterium]